MSDQQVPGFYAVGDEDTFLVSPDGQIFEVVRGGMEGPVLTRVDALPPAELHVMDGALILPSLLLQAARLLNATSSLRASPSRCSMSSTRSCGAVPSAPTWPTWMRCDATGCSSSRETAHGSRPAASAN
jgi:hypothetical protein